MSLPRASFFHNTGATPSGGYKQQSIAVHNLEVSGVVEQGGLNFFSPSDYVNGGGFGYWPYGVQTRSLGKLAIQALDPLTVLDGIPNTVIQVTDVLFHHIPADAAYVGGAGSQVDLTYTDASNTAILCPVISNSFISAAVGSNLIASAIINSITPCPNGNAYATLVGQGIQLRNPGAEYTTGNGTVNMYLSYQLIPAI